MPEKDTGNLAVCILLSPRERIPDFSRVYSDCHSVVTFGTLRMPLDCWVLNSVIIHSKMTPPNILPPGIITAGILSAEPQGVSRVMGTRCPAVNRLSFPPGELSSLFPLKVKIQLGSRCFYHSMFFSHVYC